MDLNLMPEDVENIDIDDGNIEPQPLEDFSGILPVCEPHVGMVFDTLEASHVFWNTYGRASGFSTKIRSTKSTDTKPSVVNSRDYTCRKEGKKAEDDRNITSKRRAIVRCGCPSVMKVRLVKNTNKFIVTKFVKEHNHPMEGKLTVHYLPSHRDINDIQAKAIDHADAASLGPKTMHRYMSLQAGGSANLGFLPVDIKSYLRTKRQKNLKLGEANSILEYFRQKKRLFPSFFHDYQYDRQGKLTNIFWADSRMIADYEAYGDVIMFDTTFGTYKDSRPLGIFTGFNNHRQCVVFGGCLLFDETIPSFAWVFKTFLDCHGEKEPLMIFTDQDIAMRSALEAAMPKVRHCLCSWHIVQNAAKNMSGKLKGKFPLFLEDLKSCMYVNCEIETFQQMWNHMTEKYDIVGDSWLNGLYDRKEQWSIAYRMNIFSAGVRSTQLVECANGKLKKELGTSITMRKFFKGFDHFLDGRRERETISDVKSRQSSLHVPVQHSRILNHAAKVYTPHMFDRFSKQFDLMHDILLDKMNIIQGPHVRTAFDNNREFRIIYDPSSVTISCSCCMFEMCGYLCAHILRVFDVCGVHEIPEKYILKRWTIYARSGLSIVNYPAKELSNAEKITMVMSNFSRLAYHTKGKSMYVERIMKFIMEEERFIDKNESEANGNEIEGIQFDTAAEQIDGRITGLKEKQSNKGRKKKRALSCLEKSKQPSNIEKKKPRIVDGSSSQVATGQAKYDDVIDLSLKF